MANQETIGLIAGWGDYPVEIARKIKESGRQTCCVALAGHANPELAAICDAYKVFGLGRFGSQIRFLRRHGVTKATMAGKIFKATLLSRFAWIRHRPDLIFWRYFFGQFVSGTENRNDDHMLMTAVRLYADHGIRLCPATDFAPEILVKKGLLTKRPLTKSQLNDIRFGWHLAKSMGRLDIGQSVAVKGRAVLAVEAIEGTDECIRRAGQFCSSGGFTVVKVAKPQQDLRFDMPTVGLGTIESMKTAGGKVLAIESDMTILLNQTEMLDLANQSGITIVSLNEASLASQLLAG